MTHVTHALYLIAIVISTIGVLALNQRFATGVLSRRLPRVVLVTVPIFLAFDLLGAWRGWFTSNPHLNLLIIPPGIPLEEPFLLAFLTVVSLSLWRGLRKARA